jgi:hypothetical protein
MIKWLAIFLVSSFAERNTDEIVKVNTQKVIVNAGSDSVIKIAIEIKDGYHIQANEVKDPFIPTTLEIKGDREIIIKDKVFPPAKKFKLEGTDYYLDVYDGIFEINIFFTTKKEIRKALHHLYGQLNYQACDSVRCLFPKTVEFSLDVEFR